jgi:hypothetical protein
MIRILWLLLLIIIGSCGHNNETRKAQSQSPLIDLKNRFKFQNLKRFEVDTLDMETRLRNYRVVDSASFKLIFQEGARQFSGEGYDRDYFYSWQDRDSNLIEFTILTQDESSYCDLIQYYIFDRSGKFISKFDVAANCGDGGWTFTGKGKAITDNQFIYETVESEVVEAISSVDEKLEGDSIGYRVNILTDGQIKKNETYKKPISN